MVTRKVRKPSACTFRNAIARSAGVVRQRKLGASAAPDAAAASAAEGSGLSVQRANSVRRCTRPFRRGRQRQCISTVSSISQPTLSCCARTGSSNEQQQRSDRLIIVIVELSSLKRIRFRANQVSACSTVLLRVDALDSFLSHRACLFSSPVCVIKHIASQNKQTSTTRTSETNFYVRCLYSILSSS